MTLKRITLSLVVLFILVLHLFAQERYVEPQYKVSLNEAHKGYVDIDSMLLNSYGQVPQKTEQFFMEARTYFENNVDADFSNVAIIEMAQKYDLPIIGGPMLGDLKCDGVTLLLRVASDENITLKIRSLIDRNDTKTVVQESVEAGTEQHIVIGDLQSKTPYSYDVLLGDIRVSGGTFTTAPQLESDQPFRVVFGSCMHKIGVHNLNLIDQILKREPDVMLLLGDNASDGRGSRVNLTRSDYLLRDLSQPFARLSANVPVYATWDDHDYYGNDKGGVFGRFTAEMREANREAWNQNWNNPKNNEEGINFSTHLGSVEIIMLDTRSCRENERRGDYGSYLGENQQKWLLKTLKNSEATFKIISSGTMWSDYITPGKDSWGTWDTTAREEVYKLIEEENIGGVLLISGDRHGARGFTIPRPSGFQFYEFEAASLGGVPSPSAMAEDTSNQLFGYHGTDVVAFGEFTFDTSKDEAIVTFRLIDEKGNVLEENILPYSKLTPQ